MVKCQHTHTHTGNIEEMHITLTHTHTHTNSRTHSDAHTSTKSDAQTYKYEQVHDRQILTHINKHALVSLGHCCCQQNNNEVDTGCFLVLAISFQPLSQITFCAYIWMTDLCFIFISDTTQFQSASFSLTILCVTCRITPPPPL